VAEWEERARRLNAAYEEQLSREPSRQPAAERERGPKPTESGEVEAWEDEVVSSDPAGYTVHRYEPKSEGELEREALKRFKVVGG
jgi:hypothetical protein